MKITSVHINQHIIALWKAPYLKIKRPPLGLSTFSKWTTHLVLQKTGFPTAKDSWWFRNPANHFIIHSLSMFIIVISQVYSSLFQKQHPFPLVFVTPDKKKHPKYVGLPVRDLAHEAQQMTHQGAFPGRSTTDGSLVILQPRRANQGPLVISLDSWIGGFCSHPKITRRCARSNLEHSFFSKFWCWQNVNSLKPSN